MTVTYIYPPNEKHHQMPTAYVLRGGLPVKCTVYTLGDGKYKFREGAKYPLPEGGVSSTAADLFALYQMVNKGTYNGVRLLSPASVPTSNQRYFTAQRHWQSDSFQMGYSK